MLFKLSNIRLPVAETEESLPAHAARRLGIRPQDIRRLRILRKSLDARSRSDLKFVYSVVLELHEDGERRTQPLTPGSSPRGRGVWGEGDVQTFEQVQFHDPSPGNEPLTERPVIVGSGPAGLLTGYYLAAKGYCPLIIERGQPVKGRVSAIRAFDAGGEHDPDNNYLFGEGGAGCFSDGKLTCRLSGPDVDWALERFVECGGKESIRYEQRPHLGSNKLPLVCRNFRRKIEAMGGEYRFGCRLEKLDVADGRVRGVMTSSGYLATSQVILAIGHSARDTYHMLFDLEVPMHSKPFQLGLRIEQPQEQINRHQYGRKDYVKILGAAEYSLVAPGQKDLYTFCMCAGGFIIPSVSEPGMFCTNGMSYSRHDSHFANSGVVVTLDPSEFGSPHPLAGVELQRRYESAAFRLAGRNYECPIQTAADFLADRDPDPHVLLPCSYRRGAKSLNLSLVVPPSVARAIRAGLPIMDRKWRGEFLRNATLVGPEMRGSSPIRIDRDPHTRQCPGFAGLYPVGEGAGYAGGIISAGVDGLRSARKIVERFAPLQPARV